MRSSSRHLDDVPELMQHIQSRLPAEAAACTSILSKSWLHAWSTIPTLKFYVPNEQEREHKTLMYIYRTLSRYLHNNIPIESFDLDIQIKNSELASIVENWIGSMATKTCLKELSLTIDISWISLTLPEEILSSENLTKLRVITSRGTSNAAWMTTRHHTPVVKCVCLRELHLSGVRISQQLLDHILSSCKLLAKIELIYCSQELKTIKVENLPCLEELEIVIAHGGFTSVEINQVPNLRLFRCNQLVMPRYMLPIKGHLISLGSSVTQLLLGGPGLVTDHASLDMVKSGFPFLESLTLDMTGWTLGSFHFTCASPIRRFSLISCPNRVTDIQVNAPKLLFFSLNGYTMPRLLFPVSPTLEEIKLQLIPARPCRAAFFLKMRAALELSSKCVVHITTCWKNGPPLDMGLDLDDLKTRLQFPPATNVKTLSFDTSDDKWLWKEDSPFFDAIFEICHPKLVTAKLMLREVLEKKTSTMASWAGYLKHVYIRACGQTKWETLTDSHKSFLDEPAPTYADFKFDWS